MHADKLWLLNDFIGSNKVQYKIPVYQRNYDWSEDNCNRLLDDIRNIVDTGDKHFIGTIVYMAEDGKDYDLKKRLVIDGQQRLTTMMLLLKALEDIARTIDDRYYEEIKTTYLENSFCDETNKLKLKPIKEDNVQFVALMNDRLDELDKKSHIYLNYMLCKKRLKKWIDEGVSIANILKSLAKLEMVFIQLEKDKDDPQLIFESINSTGVDLSNADLIRNFLLMNAPNQEELFENYWLYIEKNLKLGTDYSNLNQFFLQYVVYKTNKTVVEGKLYEQFVKLFKAERFNSEQCLSELKYFADIFKNFVYETDDYTPKIRKSLQSLRMLKQTTCYPFLMHVFNDYKQGIISIEVLEQVVEFIFAYLLRRIVCNVASNSLRGFFTALYGRIFKVKENKQKYYAAINKFIFTINSRDAMPSAQEFKHELKNSNIYRKLDLCKFILLDIENGDTKEKLSADELTIEHIMPQTLSREWRYISETEHNEFVHTLGNLSITGYNSEMSNKNFKEKKQIIKKHSKAVILNSDILDKDEWNIECIKARSERLAAIIAKRYAIMPVKDDMLEFEYVVTISLDQYREVTGRKLVNFHFDNAIYQQKYWGLMLVDVLQILYDIDAGKLEFVAKNNYNASGSSSNRHPRITKNAALLQRPSEVSNGIYVEMCTQSYKVMKLIKILFEFYKIDFKRFSVSVIAE